MQATRRKGFQRALGSGLQGLAVSAGRAVALGETAGGFAACGRVGQRGAQPHEFRDRAVVVSRNAQVAEGLGRIVAHTGQEHAGAVQFHGQHVVLEFVGLARVVDQLVFNAGAYVAQVLVFLARCAARH
ncbi:hypothetical protein D3C72_1165180 [compost metagenome]